MVAITKARAMKEFGARLEEAFAKVAEIPKRGRPKRVEERYKRAFSYQAVQKWFKGDSIPEQAHIAMICTDLKISVDWLFTGEGAMLIADRQDGRWPFNFDAHRFYDLTPGQRITIEGIVLGAVTDYERMQRFKSTGS